MIRLLNDAYFHFGRNNFGVEFTRLKIDDSSRRYIDIENRHTCEEDGPKDC